MSTADPGNPAGPGAPGKPANISDLTPPPPLPAPAPAAAPARKPYTASGFQIHMWGLTNFSYYYQYQLFALVFVILTVGYGLDPEVVGLALFFPRLIDAFVDPVVGHFSDITKTRWGRRRPFMIVCSILAAFVGIILWRCDPNWPKWAQLIYLCFFVTLYFTIVMTFELTRNALSYELSDDYSIRSKIMAIGNFWGTLPQVLGGAATYWFVQQVAKGETCSPGIPDFKVGWALGLVYWVGGAALIGFLIGYVMLRSRRLATRWVWGVATAVVLLVAVPATSFALHGVQGTKAMFHTLTFEEPALAAASQPAPATAPASQASTQTDATSRAFPEAASTIQAYPAAAATASQTQPATAATSQATTRTTAAAPALPKSTTWGLDYPGFDFFTYKFPNLGSEVAGIRLTSLIVGVIVIVFAIIPTIFIKERFQNYNEKHVSLWIAFKATLRNKAFVVTILLRLAQTLGTVLYGNLNTFIIIYYVCHGNKSQFSAVLGFGGAVLGLLFTILIWPLAAPLTKLIGKRWGLILGFGSALLQAIMWPFITRPGWIWYILGSNLFFSFFISMQGIFFSSIQPDICDVDELTSGERREGLYAAVYSFINKLEISVVMLLTGFLLTWVGFDTKAASQNIMPPPEVITRLMWWAFAPLIFFAGLAVIFAFFNPLTPKAMEKVHEELEKRRAQTRVVPPELA